MRRLTTLPLPKDLSICHDIPLQPLHLTSICTTLHSTLEYHAQYLLAHSLTPHHSHHTVTTWHPYCTRPVHTETVANDLKLHVCVCPQVTPLFSPDRPVTPHTTSLLACHPTPPLSNSFTVRLCFSSRLAKITQFTTHLVFWLRHCLTTPDTIQSPDCHLMHAARNTPAHSCFFSPIGDWRWVSSLGSLRTFDFWLRKLTRCGYTWRLFAHYVLRSKARPGLLRGMLRR